MPTDRLYMATFFWMEAHNNTGVFSVTADESVMKALAAGQSREMLMFVVSTPDVYAMCLSLLWNTKYL